MIISNDSINASVIDSTLFRFGGEFVTRDEILQALLDRLGDGQWMLAVLMTHNKPLNKEKLGSLTNEFYRKFKNKDLIGSRHTLDELTARLEGAGLVDIPDLGGRARFYVISKLGKELIQFKEHQT